jgi:hypothetical protein
VTVEVERIPSRKQESERAELAPSKKQKSKNAAVVGAAAKKKAKKLSKKRLARLKRKRRRRMPSFSNLPAGKSRINPNVPESSRVNQLGPGGSKPLSRPKWGGRGYAAYSGLSAGMPGNEEVDPPRRSSSTPADRARAILKG